MKIKDEFPNRITNPLLELPYYPPKSSLGTEPLGAELWKIIPLYFPMADTFPLSYYAKILGFDASLLNETIENVSETIDFEALQLKKCKNDKWKQIPMQSKFSQHVKSLKASSLQKRHSIILDEVDPMWTAILEQYRGHRDDLYRPSSEISKENFICDDCISFAKRLKLLSEEITFRPALLSDTMSLNQLVTVSSLLLYSPLNFVSTT